MITSVRKPKTDLKKIEWEMLGDDWKDYPRNKFKIRCVGDIEENLAR